MSKPLVIVESPTKVRTLKKYLGKALESCFTYVEDEVLTKSMRYIMDYIEYEMRKELLDNENHYETILDEITKIANEEWERERYAVAQWKLELLDQLYDEDTTDYGIPPLEPLLKEWYQVRPLHQI